MQTRPGLFGCGAGSQLRRRGCRHRQWGTPQFHATRRSLAPGGRWTMVGQLTGDFTPFNPAQMFLRCISRFSSTSTTRAELADVLQLIGQGAIRPSVTCCFGLADAAGAHEVLERGAVLGRYVLTPTQLAETWATSVREPCTKSPRRPRLPHTRPYSGPHGMARSVRRRRASHLGRHRPLSRNAVRFPRYEPRLQHRSGCGGGSAKDGAQIRCRRETAPAFTSTSRRLGMSSRTPWPIAMCRKSGGRRPDRSFALDPARLLASPAALPERS